jgi:hypothetical protein
VVSGEEIFFFAVAAQGDYVGMLAEEQDVGDRAGFAGCDELTLQRASLGVGQESCVHLPANFFWVVHEPLKPRWYCRLLPGALQRAAILRSRATGSQDQSPSRAIHENQANGYVNDASLKNRRPLQSQNLGLAAFFQNF